MKKFIALMLTALLVMGIVSGCGTPANDDGSAAPAVQPADEPAEDEPAAEPQADGPVQGGTFITVIPGDPETYNPNMAMDEGGGMVAFQMYNNLVMLTSDYDIVPDLAESWEYNEDNTVLTFKLREGVKWHDGEDFTAEDVVFTMNTIKEQNWASSSSLTNVVSVEAPDDYTVVFTSSAPDVTLHANLAWFSMYILPKHIHENTDWASNPVFNSYVGTGPFKFVSAQTGVMVEFEANKDYFGEGPYIDRLIFQIVPDAQTELQMWKNGEIDYMYNSLMGADAEFYENDPNTNVRLNMLCNRNYITFNFQKEDNPFLDVRLRRALSLALDREQIFNVALSGLGAPAEYYISPMYDWALNEDAKIPARDVEAAKALLVEMGYTPDADGIYFSFTLPTFMAQNELVVIQSNLREAGIDMTVEMMDQSAWMEKVLMAQDFDVTLLGGDQGPEVSSIGARIGTGGSVNVGLYSNPEADDLLARGAQTGDLAERAEIYKEVQAIMAEDLPMVIITDTGMKYAASTNVHGLPMVDDAVRPLIGKLNLSRVWIEE
ncbi:MAG: ABC transporter substrate-binding protein [Clostridiales bacterium]|jgi:peptide/nickel transport system substrate-binding protein|nr:ABC transporter substrate-binding protein [Clostridiales bacterium]